MRLRRAVFACVLAAALSAVAGCCYWAEHAGDNPVVPLLSEEQKSYLDLPRAERIAKFKDPAFRTEMKSWGDKPLARSTNWTLLGTYRWRLLDPRKESVAEGRFEAPARLSFTNLLAGAAYELEVTNVSLGEDEANRITWNVPFRTEARAPRLLDIPGIPNARDFGGWRGLDGRRIRQGLVIRSAGLNENATPKDNPDTPGATRVTDATRAVMIGQLGVKTDIDLRWDKEVFGMTGSPLGPEVRWVRCPWSLYQWVAGDKEKAMFATIFRLLLDPANLPAVVHCIEGQDRTGTLCFILQGLLGVSDEDKLRDWETTGFTNPNWGFRHESRLDPFLKYLATLPGDTVNERCVSYARSCGVTDAEIAAWRDRMLEDAR